MILFQGNGLYPAQYRVSREKIKVKKEAYLDPNHTHFILVDNGTEHQFAVEIPFRAKLENTVANMTTDTGKGLCFCFNWMIKSIYNRVSDCCLTPSM